MNEIKAKIYYEILNGKIITITPECQSYAKETTKEQDMEMYIQLQSKNIDEIDYIELPYGTLASTFKNVKSYLVNLKTKKLDCIYYSEEELNSQISEQAEQQLIQDRISLISDYASINNTILDSLESAIIEYETNLIMGGI